MRSSDIDQGSAIPPLQRTSEEPHGTGAQSRNTTIWALAFAALILLLGLQEEPFHIDEIRQTRSYERPIEQVIDASFAQDQPPLDAVLNALVQRVIGIGDWQQRILSVAFGIAGFVAFAVIGTRNGFGRGMPYGILVLGFSPLLLSVFAYARPYALPFFLMMVFLLSTDAWLKDARAWSLPLICGSAIALPLSRTLEPNIFLVSVVAVLVVRLRHDRWSGGTVWVPVNAAAIGVGAVGVPILVRLQSELSGYTEQGILPSEAQLVRLVTDLPAAVARSFPLWPALVIIAVFVLVDPRVRRALATVWWVWVLLLTPLGFTLLFLLTTDPAQPLYDRYLFSWVPLLAVSVAAVVSTWTGFHDRVPHTGAVFAVTLLLGAGAIQIVADLSTTDRQDWKALSAVIEDALPVGSVVLFDQLRPLGTYRTFFSARPRYLGIERMAPLSLDIIESPDQVPNDAPLAVALDGPAVDMDGWYRISVDDFLSLYLPQQRLTGPLDAAVSLEAFSREFGRDEGSAMALAAASLYAEEDHLEKACAIVADFRSDRDLRPRVDALLSSSRLDWEQMCDID